MELSEPDDAEGGAGAEGAAESVPAAVESAPAEPFGAVSRPAATAERVTT